MKILLHLLSGLVRSIRCWKWIFVIWIWNLLLVTLLTFPLKSAVNISLGSSMIRERLTEGYFLDVLSNSGFDLKTILSFFFSGLFLVLFAGVILNIFFAGGLFNTLREDGMRRKAADFLGSAGANFWSFLIISVIVFFILFFLSGIIIGIPSLIALSSKSDFVFTMTAKISAILLLVLWPLVILIADYSRIWQVSSGEKNGLRAIVKGFSLLFKNLLRSYLSVVPVLAIQLLFTLIAIRLILYARPAGSGGIFLLYILGQAFAIIKIFLRSWRYGTVTDLYEASR